ncbi:deazapurine DNA modification protein DpdA family protein [Nocardia yamanashiensis]|uniref:deazapurine DNA modification protein DpdA family protein n=1 Tax=Nocardia yamanashiensis TaxID=209247 RepID=UPI0012FE1F2B|nr:hypothetical protein [Nocardia yamanashiensis]
MRESIQAKCPCGSTSKDVDTHDRGYLIGCNSPELVANLLELRDLAADLPIMPVLQGWQVGDYLRCAQMYLDAGIDLTSEPIVGVGSVCRRQSSRDAAEIFATLHDQLPGIRMHGFGVKTEGLGRYGDLLASADSCSWSKAAEHEPPLPGCTHQHCQNCLRYALRWRDRVLAAAAEQARRPRGIQLSLDMSAA